MQPAGNRDKRVIIYAPTIVRDAYGAETKTYTALATVWASIEPLTGREYWEAQKINAEITHKVKIQYRSRIRLDFQLLYGYRTFEILSAISPLEANRETRLFCKETVPDA